MKQHIVPKQFKEMDESTAVKLFDLVPRNDWFKYHHKKVTVGKMIEILDERDKVSLIEVLSSYNESLKLGVTISLCDELWNRVKTIRIH